MGLAVLSARRATVAELWALGDLAGLGAVFYGDVGTAQRRDLPKMEEPTRRRRSPTSQGVATSR